jgi:hypothetical protein
MAARFGCCGPQIGVPGIQQLLHNYTGRRPADQRQLAGDLIVADQAGQAEIWVRVDHACGISRTGWTMPDDHTEAAISGAEVPGRSR